MALNPSTNGTMSGRITAPDANYPYGSSKDESGAGVGDGTPYFKARADDVFGFQQAMLSGAGIVPSGNADSALVSQYIEALGRLVVGLPYSTSYDYPLDVIVRGSDGGLYRCAVVNGPSTTVVDPVGDITGAWRKTSGEFTLFENLAGVVDGTDLDWSLTGFQLSDFDAILTVYDVGTHVVSSLQRPADLISTGRSISSQRTSTTGNAFNGGLELITETTARTYQVDTVGFAGQLTGLYGLRFGA